VLVRFRGSAVARDGNSAPPYDREGGTHFERNAGPELTRRSRLTEPPTRTRLRVALDGFLSGPEGSRSRATSGFEAKPAERLIGGRARLGGNGFLAAGLFQGGKPTTGSRSDRHPGQRRIRLASTGQCRGSRHLRSARLMICYRRRAYSQRLHLRSGLPPGGLLRSGCRR
jgi:hypothetical protein